ncbi:molybdopterin-guanine dinucleotide biosynthesis protein A [Nakamurella sp. UYEF19]|uniref:molybdenum cofactor guanylyltransferase n=1 Tax=Nakamurella sp. UYEF19 TaxID=1756392 RepID=UPI003391AB24
MPPASAPDRPGLAVIVAGGAGRRLGLVDKPALTIDGRTLLSVALAAVAPARTVVVGPSRELSADVLQIRENPPGGGPAAALAAGLAALADSEIGSDRDELVVVLASDLPGIDAAAVDDLARALSSTGVDGAVLVDVDGRSQYLAGVWRWGPLTAAVRSRTSWHDARLADLLEPLIGARVPAARAITSDINTPADLAKWRPSGPAAGDS